MNSAICFLPGRICTSCISSVLFICLLLSLFITLGTEVALRHFLVKLPSLWLNWKMRILLTVLCLSENLRAAAKRKQAQKGIAAHYYSFFFFPLRGRSVINRLLLKKISQNSDLGNKGEWFSKNLVLTPEFRRFHTLILGWSLNSCLFFLNPRVPQGNSPARKLVPDIPFFFLPTAVLGLFLTRAGEKMLSAAPNSQGSRTSTTSVMDYSLKGGEDGAFGKMGGVGSISSSDCHSCLPLVEWPQKICASAVTFPSE